MTRRAEDTIFARKKINSKTDQKHTLTYPQGQPEDFNHYFVWEMEAWVCRDMLQKTRKKSDAYDLRYRESSAVIRYYL